MKVTGIDVCSGGWFAAKLTENSWDVKIFKTIEEVTTTWNDSELFLVNVPIGLLHGSIEERKCDIEIRKLLNSSLLDLPAVPCREAVYCNSFGTANVINKRLTGRNISTRFWDIVGKIKELDEFLIKNLHYRDRFKECNCEIAFFVLNGKLMTNSKMVLAGYNERRDVLRRFYPNVDAILNYSIDNFRRKEVKTENVLDAVCLAVNGLIGLKRGFISIPKEPEYDNNNIKIQIEIPQFIECSYDKYVI